MAFRSIISVVTFHGYTQIKMKSLHISRCFSIRNQKVLTSYVQHYARKISSTNSSNPLDWNGVVSDAKRVVGYPTSYLSLRCLLGDEISNLAAHVRKLVGTGHPLLKTAKLLYNGNASTYTHGLVVLLLSKTAGHKNVGSSDDPITDGISFRQKNLAEITEMIHMAHQIHRSVVNATNLIYPNISSRKDMEFGNKIATLCGDYLLASALKTLASLNHPDVVELIIKATRDFTQAEFSGDHDIHGNAVSIEAINLDNWEKKNYHLSTASLLAQSCQSALALANHEQKLQNKAFIFGKMVALTWQINLELQPFIDSQKHPPGTPFDLTSLPVLIHIKEDPELLNYIRKHKENLDNVDYKLVQEAVQTGIAIDKTKLLCKNYAQKSLTSLKSFKDSDANVALRKIIDALYAVS